MQIEDINIQSSSDVFSLQIKLLYKHTQTHRLTPGRSESIRTNQSLNNVTEVYQEAGQIFSYFFAVFKMAIFKRFRDEQKLKPESH